MPFTRGIIAMASWRPLGSWQFSMVSRRDLRNKYSKGAIVTKPQTKVAPAVAGPRMVSSESGAVDDAPAGNPELYAFKASSLSHSWPVMIACVIAFVLESYVVVRLVAVWIAAANNAPV